MCARAEEQDGVWIELDVVTRGMKKTVMEMALLALMVLVGVLGDNREETQREKIRGIKRGNGVICGGLKPQFWQVLAGATAQIIRRGMKPGIIVASSFRLEGDMMPFVSLVLFLLSLVFVPLGDVLLLLEVRRTNYMWYHSVPSASSFNGRRPNPYLYNTAFEAVRDRRFTSIVFDLWLL